MAEQVNGMKIANLPGNTTMNDTDVMIVETAAPKTGKITFLNLCKAIVAKLASITTDKLETTAKTVIGAINELNSTTQWKFVGTVTGINTISIPDEAKELKAIVVIRPKENTANQVFTCEFGNDFSSVDNQYHMTGYYYSPSYFSCICIHAKKGSVEISPEWLKIQYDTTMSYDELAVCELNMYYK